MKLGKVVDDATFGRILQLINKHSTLGDFYADNASTAEAIGELQKSGVINSLQVSEMFDGDSISAIGKDMLENMLIGKAFESNPDAVRQASELKSMRQCIVTALAEISNNLHLGVDYSLGRELSEAIHLVYQARRNGGYKSGDKVSDYARQMNIFPYEEGETVADYHNAVVMTIADIINDSRVTLLKKYLQIYNNRAKDYASGQLDMFADGLLTKEDILNEVKTLFTNGTEEQKQAALDNAVGTRIAEVDAEATPVDDVGEGGNGGSEDTGGSATGQSDLEQTEITAPLSEEVNDFDRPFILSSDGTTIFGEITEDSGLTAAPIKLSLGENGIDENGAKHGYGLLHIEAGHGDQIRAAGFSSVEEFVETVAKNYDTIREGNVIDNNQTYLLEVSDEYNNTLFIQLSRDGSYWNVNSAGIFRKKYSRRKRKVASLPTIGNSSNTETVEVNRSQTKGVTATSENSSLTSADKDNEKSATEQGKSEKVSENKTPNAVTAPAVAEAVDNAEPAGAQKGEGSYKKSASQISMETDEEARAFDKLVPKMSDEELLAHMQEDGGGDAGKAFHPAVYDEYDYRHRDEQTEAYEHYMQMLGESGTTQEQAEDMLANLRKDLSRFATDERAELLGQEEALQDYITELENAVELPGHDLQELIYALGDLQANGRSYEANANEAYKIGRRFGNGVKNGISKKEAMKIAYRMLEDNYSRGGVYSLQFFDGIADSIDLRLGQNVDEIRVREKSYRDASKLRYDKQGNPIDSNGRLLTDKIASLDEISDDDFIAPTRSIELPKLPKNVDEAIGADGKPVVIKKNIFEKNRKDHKDLSAEDGRAILRSALYTPNLYGQSQKVTRPYNWVVINTKDEQGHNRIVLLEINNGKESVEIVHWHYIRNNALETLKRQAEREGGHILILPSESEEAGGLSSRTNDLPSAGKDTKENADLQEKMSESDKKNLLELTDFAKKTDSGNRTAVDEANFDSEGLTVPLLVDGKPSRLYVMTVVPDVITDEEWQTAVYDYSDEIDDKTNSGWEKWGNLVDAYNEQADEADKAYVRGDTATIGFRSVDAAVKFNDWVSLAEKHHTSETLSNSTDAQQLATEAVITALESAGIEVIDDMEEGQRVLDEANGDIKLMGSRTDRKMHEVDKYYKDKELDKNARAVIDVFSGKADNVAIEVERPEGMCRVIMRQGNENKAGTKHSLFRHLGSNSNNVTIGELSMIPKVISKGERTENGRKIAYDFVIEDGTGLRVTTEIAVGREVFTNFLSNRRPLESESRNNTQLSARATDSEVSDAKVGNSSETAKEKGEKNSEHQDDNGNVLSVENFSKKHEISEKQVSAYAASMQRRNLSGATRAYMEIRREVIGRHPEIKNLRALAKKMKPLREELYSAFGNMDALREEIQRRTDEERNAMEAARRREEEKAAVERQRMSELESMSDEELDKEYFKALETNDEVRVGELVKAAARRKGYGDFESEYQGVGSWSAPSNPGYKTKEERRAEIEESGTNVNIEDVAEGYSPQPYDYFSNLRAYNNDTPHGKESASAINNAISALKDGKKATVKVYRAVPLNVKESKMRNGDWVTPSRKYAEMHGAHRLEGKYHIIEQDVPADELWWDGNDINEWGYDDGKSYAYKNSKNNRKSADAVSYNDNGDLIPLSKRFDSRKSDVRYSRTSDGKLYGWTVGGKIYLTKAGINPNTPIHEYTHIWAEAMRRKNPEAWNGIKDLLRGTSVWDEVMSDGSYSGIHGNEDAVASEVLSRISGRDNSRKMEAEARRLIDAADGVMDKAKAVTLLGRMKKALEIFWSWVGKDLFGIKDFKSIDEVTDRVLYDLVSGTDLGIANVGHGRAELMMGDARETFDERQRKAVANNGTVMPGLNEAKVKIVDVPRHKYKGSNILDQARDAAIERYNKQVGTNEDGTPIWEAIPQEYNNNGISFSYEITPKALKSLVQHHTKSDNVGVHVAVLDKLDKVINDSIEIEEHPDVIKKDGVRDISKGVNDNVLMHRFIGAVIVDDKTYRIISNINVSSTNSEQNKLCVQCPLYIDTRLLRKQAIGSDGS